MNWPEGTPIPVDGMATTRHGIQQQTFLCDTAACWIVSIHRAPIASLPGSQRHERDLRRPHVRRPQQTLQQHDGWFTELSETVSGELKLCQDMLDVS